MVHHIIGLWQNYGKDSKNSCFLYDFLSRLKNSTSLVGTRTTTAELVADHCYNAKHNNYSYNDSNNAFM